MPVSFKTTSVHDRGRPQTVEESFRVYANWGGLHSLKFDSLIEVASEHIEAPDNKVYDIPVPIEVLISYEVTQYNHAVLFRYIDAVNFSMFGLYELSGNTFLRLWTVIDNVWTMTLNRPVTAPISGEVKVAFRQQKFSDTTVTDEHWDCYSMWIDDALIGTHIQEAEPLTQNPKIGLTMWSSEITYTNVRVPQLTEFAEWSSLDVGEAPMGGLKRAIEGRYIKFFMRPTGEIRAWRARETDSVKTFAQNEVEQIGRHFDARGLATHVRMLGAYEQAEFHRADLTAKYGYRFLETNNPFLMTEADCYDQAQREIQRMEEQVSTQNVTSIFTPLLEVEDRVQTPKGDAIISARSLQFMKGKIGQQLTLRRYVYGS